MYSRNEMTIYAFRPILSRLVDIVESENDIVNEIYSEPSTLRDDFKCFLDYYIKKFEELIKQCKFLIN